MHVNPVIAMFSALLALGIAVGVVSDVQAMDVGDTGVTPRMGPAGPTHGSSSGGMPPPIDPARVIGLVAVAAVTVAATVFLHQRRRPPA